MLKIKRENFHSGPKISVGLPVYNGERFLAEAIESILNQDFEDLELIISDNGSDDGTYDICRHYAKIDGRVKYYRYPKNLGSSKNGRRTLDASSGEYFMWAMDDDLREKTMITDCLSVLENDLSVVMCHTQVKGIDENGKFMGIVNDYVKVDQNTPRERFFSILWNLDVCTPIHGLIRTDALHQMPWPSSRSRGTDRIMLSELALIGRFLQIPKPLFIYRFHSTRDISTLEKNNSFYQAFNPENELEGITLPFCEFAFETLNVVKYASLDENDKAELIGEVLRCFRTRWGKQVAYETNRAIELIRRGKFRKSWGESHPVKGEIITEQYYISTILARLEMASFIFPEFPGLQHARAICLQKLGRLNEARAVASIELEKNPGNNGAKLLIESMQYKNRTA